MVKNMPKFRKGEIVKDRKGNKYKIIYVLKKEINGEQYYECIPERRTILEKVLGMTEYKKEKEVCG